MLFNRDKTKLTAVAEVEPPVANDQCSSPLVSLDEFPFRFNEPWAADEAARRADYSKRLFDAYRTADLTIHNEDEMWNGVVQNKNIRQEDHRPHYMYGGRCALKNCIDALTSAGAESPKSVLDFPSGHGRVMRFFKAAFPEAELWAGDLNEPGVQFCEQQFGAKQLVSKLDLKQVEMPRKFDLIWCGSLATHIDQPRVIELLDLLTGGLSEGGMLGITTCGRPAIWTQLNMFKFIDDALFNSAVRQFEISGFGYANYPGTSTYGMTWISPTWMYKYLENREDITLVSFAEKGWHGTQDVYFIMKRPLSHWYDMHKH